MCFLPEDERCLHRALELARDAAAFASPNPAVGCVLVRDGATLGEGAHLYDRRDHAEIAALKDAAARGNTVAGSTAYVTLEPCSHHGRTGPCADALLAAGIARCVVATADPNPQVSGRGLARLRAGGVEVLLLPSDDTLAQEARRLNDAFAFSMQHGRPFVTLKAAVSIDGYLAPPPTLRQDQKPFWLTGPAARQDVQRLRHTSDAVLTGIGTVLADDPSLTDRTGRPRRRPLLRVVLDSQLRTPLSSKLVASAKGDLLVVCGAMAPAKNEAELIAKGVEVERLTMDSQPELNAVLQRLHGRKCNSVLLEAGTELNAAFLAADLVDQVVLYFADVELGQGSVLFAHGFPPNVLQQRLQHVQHVAFAHGAREDVRVSGYLHDPWQDV